MPTRISNNSPASIPSVSAATNPIVVQLLNIARSQLGYHEGANNNNKFSPTNGLQNEPWCASFVSWCIKQSGITGTPLDGNNGSAAVLGLINQYKSSGKFFSPGTDRPQPGDLVFFGDSSNFHEHVGMVERVDPDGTVHTIEGNTSDMVARRTYPPGSSRITGFGRTLGMTVGGDSAGGPTVLPATDGAGGQGGGSSTYGGGVYGQGNSGNVDNFSQWMLLMNALVQASSDDDQTQVQAQVAMLFAKAPAAVQALLVADFKSRPDMAKDLQEHPELYSLLMKDPALLKKVANKPDLIKALVSSPEVQKLAKGGDTDFGKLDAFAEHFADTFTSAPPAPPVELSPHQPAAVPESADPSLKNAVRRAKFSTPSSA